MADDPNDKPDPARTVYVHLPANVSDMLFDQMEFLLAGRVRHLQKEECACGDCMRFMRVYDVLMEPFVEKTPVAIKSHQKKARKAAV